MLLFTDRRWVVAVLLIFPFLSFAQQDPIYTQNLFQILPFNPAYAGSKGAASGLVIYREQWTKVKGHPQSGSASFHTPISLSNIGIGMHTSFDKIGVSERYDGALALSYKAELSPTFNLNFGLQGIVEYEKVSLTQVKINNPNDPSFGEDLETKLMPNVGAGIYLYSERFILSLSSPTLLRHEDKFNELNSGYRRYQHLYGMTGYVFDLGVNVRLRTSILGKYVQGAPVYGDANATFIWFENLWTGVSLRTTKVLGFMAQIRLGNVLWLGYGYDYGLEDERPVNTPTHEIMIGFDKPGNNTTFKTPRYF